MSDDGLMRIFWPLDIPRTTSPGVIVGWKNSEFDVLVVAILEDVEVRIPTSVYDQFTEDNIGKKCRKRVEDWHPIPKCRTSHQSNI